ncbi:efflux RND transporter permease subunit, partial [Patescibacteria group bacterium]|nr:efflux RND transporter permease subunit [Patescibacteria group bacterium]
ILVDKINRNRKEEGMEIEAAIMEAGKTRLQPIILTTITTITGLLPITIKEAGWAPMGYSIIFGLLFSTLLSLIVVPLLYQKFAKKELDTNGKHYKLDEDREHQGITKEYEKTVQSQTTASIKEATHQ